MNCDVGVHYLIADIDLILKCAPLVHLPPRQSCVSTAMRFCTFLLKTSFGVITLLIVALLAIFEGDSMDMMRKESQIWTLPMSERKFLTSSKP